MLLARLRATHRPLKSPHISLPLSLSPSLAHTRPPLAQRKPASHDHSPAAPLPRRPARFQPILAICSTNCCSLPPPAQELGRATASSVRSKRRLSHSLHTRPPKRRATELPSRFRHEHYSYPRCEERPAVVSKGDSRRSLFGSFDICAASV